MKIKPEDVSQGFLEGFLTFIRDRDTVLCYLGWWVRVAGGGGQQNKEHEYEHMLVPMQGGVCVDKLYTAC